MQIQAVLVSVFIFFNATLAGAQRIYTHTTFRSLPDQSYTRFHYDNDFFTKYDQYYSQGITLEVSHPVLKKNPINYLLLTPFNTKAQYGLTFNIFGFTPKSILSNTILYGDRPFDANLSLQTTVTQRDALQKQSISTSLSIGVMGAAAKGYQIQYNIHKWLNNPLPKGWQHQIKNDVILNYQLNYEKQIAAYKHNLLLNVVGECRVGTLNNNLAAGFVVMAGSFNPRYVAINKNTRKKEIYFYLQNKVNTVAYDASLQGGLFNKNSPYTIPNNDIKRITFQADAGVVVNLRKLYLSYTQSFITKEFATGSNHRWGGISVGVAL